MKATRQPVLYVPHGGGPCFFMDWTMGPKDTWDRMAAYLRGIPASLPAPPAALLVVSAHWEARRPTVTSAPRPKLIYDYGGFPPHTYELTWPAPGSPRLAERVVSLLAAADIDAAEDPSRGFDHGVFIPMKVAFPDAEVPTVALSLVAGLDPETHLAIGRALAPLRDEGVLIVGSGMASHNMHTFMTTRRAEPTAEFIEWLAGAVAKPRAEREAALRDWASAPGARGSHPREEHLVPVFVAAGAAGDDEGAEVFRDQVMGAVVSGVRFG